MDVDTIRRKALAARQFQVAAGPAVFTLCMPTKLDAQLAYMRSAMHEGTRDPAAMVRTQRALLLGAVVGWSGVLGAHVLGEVEAATDADKAEPLPFDAQVVELLLDAQPDWEQALSSALVERINARAAVEDTAAKN
jgi:hypothetical protein